jgi:hypothetical protein
MPAKEQSHNRDKTTATRRSAQPPVQDWDLLSQQAHLATIVQLARISPSSLTPHDVLQLQRTVGNRSVLQLPETRIQRNNNGGGPPPAPPPPGQTATVRPAGTPRLMTTTKIYPPTGDNDIGQWKDLVYCPPAMAKGSQWWQLFNNLLSHNGIDGHNLAEPYWKPMIEYQQDGRWHVKEESVLKKDQGAKDVLKALWESAYRIGQTKKVELVEEEVVAQVRKAKRQIVTLYKKGDRHIMGFRGEGRTPGKMQEHGGSFSRADVPVLRAELGMDEPWHPAQQASITKRPSQMLSRPALADAEETSTVSVTPDFKTATIFPHIEDLLKQGQTQALPNNRYESKTYVYLCAIPKGTTAMNPLAQEDVLADAEVFMGGEYQVRSIPARDVWGVYTVERTHYGETWHKGHKAKVIKYDPLVFEQPAPFLHARARDLVNEEFEVTM